MNFEDYRQIIEKGLCEYNKEMDNPQSTIYKAMNYSLLAGGKRLRPVLLLEFCRLCGGDYKTALPFACAMEMIHTYSLIHDDLPAMDNDDLRRGRPTCHIQFDEATAILAGDALLNRAFEIMTMTKLENTGNQIDAIHMIADCSGENGMIGGQVVDLQSEGKKISYDELKHIHSLKTGALIKAACCGGAILGGADKETLDIVTDFAINLGVAFQIRDDILDVVGSEAELGKPIGSDEKCEKNTYVTIFGLEMSEELCDKYTNAALEALSKIKTDEDKTMLTEFVKNLSSRTN